MAYHRPISVTEAAKLAGVTRNAILKRIDAGTLMAVQLNGKAWMVCREDVNRRKFSESEFRRLCGQYISVPQACDIVYKTDASVIRDLRGGRLSGFRLNGRAWAVLRSSAEQEIRDYIAGSHDSLPGQRRRIGERRSPEKKVSLQKKRTTVQSRRRSD
jgi:excisionase family DNA binding protein